MMGWYGYGGQMAWPAWILMILLIALIAGGIALLAILLTRPPRIAHQAAGGQARRVLDERFARGELDVEEYRRRRDVLDDRRPS